MFSNTEFRCTIQAFYGVEQTMLAPHVGMNLGRGNRLDPHGHLLTTMIASGPGWRGQHDDVKNAIARSASECKVEHTCEVYGVFAAYVGQNDMTGSHRQGMVPDFMFKIDHRESLAELKTIHQGRTWWTRRTIGTRCGALEKRQVKIPGEYHKKARNCDSNYNGWDAANPIPGPMQTRLAEFGPIKGLVVGPRGPASSGLHELMVQIAEVGAEISWRAMGARSVLEARSTLINRIRRTIGITASRAAARLMIERLGVARGDGREAAKRRRNADTSHRSFEREHYFANGPRAFAGGQPRKGW